MTGARKRASLLRWPGTAAAFVIAAVIAVAVGGWIGTTFAHLGIFGAEVVYLALVLCAGAVVAGASAIVRTRRARRRR
jgi:hypothetical protein